MIKRIFTLLSLLVFHISLFAQDKAEEVEMADVMRSSGRIYVVVAVLLAIFAGIIIYLIRLDKKITRLEKSQFINSK
jgi:cytochrome bd-type quinol oxidase subunit 2